VTVVGRAQVIVSGDDDLLALSPSEQIAIVRPDRFPAMLDAIEPRSRQ
jgi:predicted nucleic acid-binding protein